MSILRETRGYAAPGKFQSINQRGEDSENRIKELKLDFSGDTLPCSDFNANALYFSISALSYNLFALMRQLLPEPLAFIRYSGRTGRQLIVKLQAENKLLLEQATTKQRK